MVNTLVPLSTTALAAAPPGNAWQALAAITNAQQLRRTLLLLHRFISERPPAPILANFLLESGRDGTLTLSATDLSRSIRITLLQPTRTQSFRASEGSITLPCTLVKAWACRLMRQPTQPSITIQTRQGHDSANPIAIFQPQDLDSRTAFTGMAVSEFPILPTPESDVITTRLTLPLGQLQQAIVAVLPSASRKPTALYSQIGGVNCQSEGDGILILTATDEQQISQYRLDCPPGLKVNATIDRRFLVLLAPLVREKQADTVTLAFSETHAYFTCTTKKKPQAGRFELTTRLLEGVYPYLPNLSELWTLEVDRRWLLTQLEIALQCSQRTGGHRAIRLTSNAIASNLTLTGAWHSEGTLLAGIQATTSVSNVFRSAQIDVNSSKLHRVLKAMAVKMIRLGLNTPFAYQDGEAPKPAVIITSESNPFVHSILALQTTAVTSAPTAPTMPYYITLPEQAHGAVLLRPLERQHAISLASPRGDLKFSLLATNATIEALRDQVKDGKVNLTRAEVRQLYRERDSKPKTTKRKR